MSKGEAYKAYYRKNRDRILEASRERNRVARQETPQEVREDLLERRRQAYQTRKARRIASRLLEKSRATQPFWVPFYERIASFGNLNTLKKKQIDFLLTLDGMEERAQEGDTTVANADE